MNRVLSLMVTHLIQNTTSEQNTGNSSGAIEEVIDTLSMTIHSKPPAVALAGVVAFSSVPLTVFVLANRKISDKNLDLDKSEWEEAKTFSLYALIACLIACLSYGGASAGVFIPVFNTVFILSTIAWCLGTIAALATL